jgi:hypothetical protein
MRRSGGSGAPA